MHFWCAAPRERAQGSNEYETVAVNLLGPHIAALSHGRVGPPEGWSASSHVDQQHH